MSTTFCSKSPRNARHHGRSERVSRRAFVRHSRRYGVVGLPRGWGDPTGSDLLKADVPQNLERALRLQQRPVPSRDHIGSRPRPRRSRKRAHESGPVPRCVLQCRSHCVVWRHVPNACERVPKAFRTRANAFRRRDGHGTDTGRTRPGGRRERRGRCSRAAALTHPCTSCSAPRSPPYLVRALGLEFQVVPHDRPRSVSSPARAPSPRPVAARNEWDDRSTWRCRSGGRLN
jgi:hypothetical protein